MPVILASRTPPFLCGRFWWSKKRQEPEKEKLQDSHPHRAFLSSNSTARFLWTRVVPSPVFFDVRFATRSFLLSFFRSCLVSSAVVLADLTEPLPSFLPFHKSCGLSLEYLFRANRRAFLPFTSISVPQAFHIQAHRIDAEEERANQALSFPTGFSHSSCIRAFRVYQNPTGLAS